MKKKDIICLALLSMGLGLFSSFYLIPSGSQKLNVFSNENKYSFDELLLLHLIQEFDATNLNIPEVSDSIQSVPLAFNDFKLLKGLGITYLQERRKPLTRLMQSFLADWSLAGLRVWDGIRAIDYLISRPEVDTTKLGVVGNSGGGQMSFLIAAVDESIKVCVAAHPGGPMENTYLKGYGLGSQRLIDREILSLIAPRPCRVIVGRDSGEEKNSF